MIQDHEMIPSYLPRPFLPGPSLNNPQTSSYHLQIFSQFQNHSQPLTNFINTYQLNPKHLHPKKPTILYLKQPQKISHFL
ncbi:DNA-binding protein WhiA, partial [Staphylococcus pasteuri]|uniref:DNA-binding protein WhiA n=1 Tax=Staphylococcus pasteuri TaxID=45972 RepID=UPI0028FC274F